MTMFFKVGGGGEGTGATSHLPKRYFSISTEGLKGKPTNYSQRFFHPIRRQVYLLFGKHT